VIEYRGIKIDNPKALMKNGELKTQVKNGLDKFIDLLKENNHILKSEYKNNATKVLIDYQCGHESSWVLPHSYSSGHGCSKCYWKRGAEIKIQKGKSLFLKNIKENKHVLLSEYKGSLEKVLIDFKCGHEPQWMQSSNYNSGARCLECYNEHRGEKILERAKKEFTKLVKKNNHILLSSYKGDKTKVLIDLKCGHEPHWITPNVYKQGQRCPICRNEKHAKRRLKEGEKTLISSLRTNGHILLSEYKGAHTKVLIDFKCEHKPRLVFPNDYVSSGIRCRKCSNQCPEQSEENFLEIVKKVNYKVLEKFEKTNQPVKIQCDKGHVFKVRPNNFVRLESRCPWCQNRSPEQTKERFLKAIEEEGYLMIGEYQGNGRTKVKVLCNKGHDWSVRPTNFINQGARCIKCGKKSKGEQIIRKWLKDKDILYEQEYLIQSKLWRYDIYIPSVNTIVEIQGIQHYEEIKFFKRSLKEERANDKKKRRYAEKLGYNYIVVDYREHNPELALERFLDQFKLYKPLKRNKSQYKRSYEQLSLF
jgi:hypothetical protein